MTEMGFENVFYLESEYWSGRRDDGGTVLPGYTPQTRSQLSLKQINNISINRDSVMQCFALLYNLK